MTRFPMTTLVPILLFAIALAACGETPGDVLPDPRGGRSGIQMSGLLRDRQIAVSDGLPVLNSGDCDVNEGPDRDLCVIAEDINGEMVRVIVENPDVLQEGAVLDIGSDCASPAACDDVRDAAVLEIQFGDRPRQRAVSGTLEMEVVVPFTRYRGTFDARLDNGSVNATFDLVPRPDELS